MFVLKGMIILCRDTKDKIDNYVCILKLASVSRKTADSILKRPLCMLKMEKVFKVPYFLVVGLNIRQMKVLKQT